MKPRDSRRHRAAWTLAILGLGLAFLPFLRLVTTSDQDVLFFLGMLWVAVLYPAAIVCSVIAMLLALASNPEDRIKSTTLLAAITLIAISLFIPVWLWFLG